MAGGLALALAAWAGPAAAQPIGDAVRGQSLFENTVGAGFPQNCTACHIDVANRRIVIGAGLGRPNPTAQDYLSDDDITAAFSSALLNQPEMRPFAAFTEPQFRDVSAYIGDTPQVSLAGQPSDRSQDTVTFAFEAPAAGQPVQRDLALSHAVVPPADLVVHGVAVAGVGSAAPSGRFRLAADACSRQTLAASATCPVSVAYQPDSSAPVQELLSFDLQVGSLRFTRNVLLVGTVAGSAPPGPGASSPSAAAGGGGATAGWSLLGLLAAVVALRRR